MYWSLGLRIHCDIPLQLPDERDHSDLPDSTRTLRIQQTTRALLNHAAQTQIVAYENARDATRVTRFTLEDQREGLEFQRQDARVRFVQAHNAHRIEYAHNLDPTPSAHNDLARIIEGPILGWFLRRSGRALLHAAAVRIDGQLLAISANSGTGKSTLASFLCAAGATHASDDILVYDPTHATAKIDGRPRRLDPKVHARTDSASRPLVNAHPVFDGSPKIFATDIPILTDADRAPHPLAHILILGERTSSSRPTFERLSSAHAMIALMQGRYPSWYRTTAADREAFEHASQLAARVPVTLAHMPDGLDHLNASREEIVAWCAANVGSLTKSR